MESKEKKEDGSNAAGSSSTAQIPNEQECERDVKENIRLLNEKFGSAYDEDGYYRSFAVGDQKSIRAHFAAAGFVVIRDIPNIDPQRCFQEIFGFLQDYCPQIDLQDTRTWDSVYFSLENDDASESKSSGAQTLRAWPKGGKRQGFINVHHLPFMWQNRQNPSIVSVFWDLLQTNQPSVPKNGLWVSFDRMGLMPPSSVFKTDPTFLHWDQNPLTHPAFDNVQGLINLCDNNASTDTDTASKRHFTRGSSTVGSAASESGGFWCVPGSQQYFPLFGHHYRSIIHPKSDFASVPGPKSEGGPHWLFNHIHKVTMRANSLLIWDSRTAHGNYPNTSQDLMRFVQYITFKGAQWKDDSACLIRQSAFQNGGQYANRHALFYSFKAITHTLGTSQDVNKRMKKLKQLQHKPTSDKTEEDVTLEKDLIHQLALIGHSNSGLFALPFRPRLTEPSTWRCSEGNFSNRQFYYSPMKVVNNTEPSGKTESDPSSAVLPGLDGYTSSFFHRLGINSSQGKTLSLQPYKECNPLLTPLGKHVAGLEQGNFAFLLAASSCESACSASACSSAVGMSNESASSNLMPLKKKRKK